MIENFTKYIIQISPALANPLAMIGIKLFFILSSCLLSFWFSKKIILKSLIIIAKKTTSKWDDLLVEHKVFEKALNMIPFLILYLESNLFPSLSSFIQKLSSVIIVFILLNTLSVFADAIIAIYRGFNSSIKKPIKGYVQIVKIIINGLGYILIVSIIIDKNPSSIIAGLGAMTAILILVFKDSIMGLVASIQISSNHLVKLGDWIEVPKYGADGDVIDISLHTVKVQNWDKTITTVPTYALISDSFKNWRGMSESGGRRIKRALHIDLNTIKFCDEKLMDKLSKINLIKNYLGEKSKEIQLHNERTHSENSQVNGRCLTNIGLFRQYIIAYLNENPNIHDSMTFLVRQLDPTQHGVPLEIYVFSKDLEWVNYENIQADIFDHLFASIHDFELEIFQTPSGSDFRNLT